MVLSHVITSHYSETVGAFGTIAKFIAGINETGEEFPDYYIDYGEVHDPVYYTKQGSDPHHHHHHHHEEFQDYQDYQDYQYQGIPNNCPQHNYACQTRLNFWPQFFSPGVSFGGFSVYPENREAYYDYHYAQEQLLPTQTEKISNNFLYDEYSQYYGAEARNIEEEIDRQGQAETGQQTVEEALYIIGKNVLGTNVTNRLLPVAAQLTHGLGLIGHGFNTIGGVIRGGDKRSQGRLATEERGRPRQVEAAPACTTSKGGVGRCMDIQSCPILLVDLNVLRSSICFKSLFVPGVCCPDNP